MRVCTLSLSSRRPCLEDLLADGSGPAGLFHHFLFFVGDFPFFCCLPALSHTFRSSLLLNSLTSSIIHRRHYIHRFNLNQFQAHLFSTEAFPWIHSSAVDAPISKRLQPQETFHRHEVLQGRRLLTASPAEKRSDSEKDWARECIFLFLRLQHVARFLISSSRRLRSDSARPCNGKKRLVLPRLLQCWLIDRWTSQYITSSWEISKAEVEQFMSVYGRRGCHCEPPNETVVLQTTYQWQDVVFNAMKSSWTFTAKEMKEGTAFLSMGMAPIFMAMKEVVWFCFVFHDDGTVQLDGLWLGSCADLTLGDVSTIPEDLHVDGCTVVHWSSRGGFSVDDGVTFNDYMASLASNARWTERMSSVFVSEGDVQQGNFLTGTLRTPDVSVQQLSQSYEKAASALQSHLINVAPLDR